jgi:hypothetical protein
MSKATRTEHAGAKNGGGYWGPRAEAKKRSKKVRRERSKQLTKIVL